MNQTESGRYTKLLIYLYPVLFGLAYAQKAVFTENQNTKFITGLSLARYGDVASDWMANITDPFPVFSYLLKWQYEIFGLYTGIHLSFFLLTGIYAVFAVLLARHLLPRGRQRPMVLLIFAFLWLLIHTEGLRQFWGHFFPEGLADQYLLGEYYQPACFGVFFLGGIAAYLSGYLLLAALFFLVPPLFHPTYLLTAMLVPIAMILVPAGRKVGLTLPKRIVFVVLVAMFLIPFAAWNIQRLTSGDPVIRDKAFQLLTETRIPSHSLPVVWKFRIVLAFFISGFLAAWLERKHLIGQLLLVLMSVAAISTLGAAVYYIPTISALAPWRVSALAAPLSWVILLTGFARWIAARIENRDEFLFLRLKKTAVILIGLACAVGIVETFLNYQDKRERADFFLSRFMAATHEPGSLYLIPPGLKNLRLEAGVPVYVTWKSHPTKDVEILQWSERMNVANAFYDASIKEIPEMTAMIRAHGWTHIVWPTSGGPFPCEKIGKKSYSDNYFSLWDVRRGFP